MLVLQIQLVLQIHQIGTFTYILASSIRVKMVGVLGKINYSIPVRVGCSEMGLAAGAVASKDYAYARGIYLQCNLNTCASFIREIPRGKADNQ